MILTDDMIRREGFELFRRINDQGDYVGMLRMGFNTRLQLFDINGPYSNYCYHSRAAAIEAFARWNPDDPEHPDPTGWVKHIETNRCRPGGDPAKESIGWPLPEVMR